MMKRLLVSGGMTEDAEGSLTPIKSMVGPSCETMSPAADMLASVHRAYRDGHISAERKNSMKRDIIQTGNVRARCRQLSLEPQGQEDIATVPPLCWWY
jgi:hypothetical protein